MINNIDKVLQRGEKIDLLVDKTEKLDEMTFVFKVHSREIGMELWRRKWYGEDMIHLMLLIMLCLVRNKPQVYDDPCGWKMPNWLHWWLVLVYWYYISLLLLLVGGWRFRVVEWRWMMDVGMWCDGMWLSGMTTAIELHMWVDFLLPDSICIEKVHIEMNYPNVLLLCLFAMSLYAYLS